MYLKNEKQLLHLIRYALPLLIFLLSIIITTFLYVDTKDEFDKMRKNIEEKFISEKKQIIKDQISNLSNYIVSEQRDIVENLKKSLIERVHEAHIITTNIYNQYKDTHTKEEITLMIRTALKDIRFNNQRGYFFVYDNKAINIIHPLIPQLEGKNLINHQDTKGVYVLRESLHLLKNNDESYQEWHWRKIKGDPREFKKIGFVKNIYELNWFLGTGEYIEDFSKDMQQKVINQIEKFRFGKNSYFIVTDQNNNYISHINKKLIGKNALEKLQDMNDVVSIKKIQNTIKKKEGFVTLDFFKPNSNEISSKIIYLKTIPKWNWIISTGFYKDDIQFVIDSQKEKLTNKYNQNIRNVLIVATIVTIILLFISFYISNIIERKFKRYKVSIQRHIKENQKQYELLAQKTKLAAMGEMLENIAHQWRQPLSVIETASSSIEMYKEMDILNDKFLDEMVGTISTSAQHLSHTIEDFRDFFKPDKQQTVFNIKDSMQKTFNLLKLQLKAKNITVVQEIKEIQIKGFERELLQVLLNIINNAKDALENVDKERYIFIEIYEENNNAVIKIKDNAGGIQKEIIERIFEPYFTTKHQSQGTGIGLYMSQEIISRHMKGVITVNNKTYTYKDKEYTGACFEVYLPL